MSYTTEIIRNLFIGNKEASKEPQKNYGLIVNCAHDLVRHEPHTSEYYLHLPLDDLNDEVNNEKMFKLLDTATETIHSVLNTQKNVLVHCHMGISRSATVITAFLIRYVNMTLVQAIVYIKNRHPLAFSYNGVNFEKALVLFANKYGKLIPKS